MVEYRNGMPAGLIEVAWIKSSASAPNGQCVELAALGAGRVAVRNSTDPEGVALIFRPGEFDAFLSGAKAGEFDHLPTV
ncbi:DUF397 domain-containing protein [Kitasatospora sp. NBC_01560]|uniref:DUF397 domain-containing protein n=1 Tax=Kitasatospora sp. NBC_01560 TaxID=2975965 RepID=UPI00386C66B8